MMTPTLTYEVPERAESGEDLVVRIPAGLAARIGLEPGEPCTLSVHQGKLVISTANASAWAQLEQLLATEYKA